MNEQFWSKVTEGINERFTDEAAEYFAKHAPAEYDGSDCSEYNPAPVKISPEKESSKKRRLWIGIGSAAAAVLLCVAGGAFLMRGGDPLLSVADPTTEVTAETSESIETSEQLIIEVTAEAEVIESAETTDIPDPDAWQSMKLYTGDDPETLAFINEISAGALEYQEQYQQDSLENAQDDSYREAAQQAIDEGGLDIIVESAVYVQTDSGDEFWMKAYRIKMALNAELHEIYYRSEDGFELLHTAYNGMMLNTLCDGEALYYSQGDDDLGIVEKLMPDGSRDELLSVNEEASEYYAEGLDMLWVTDIMLTGSGKRLTVNVNLIYRSEATEDMIYRRDTHIYENDELINTSSTGYGYAIINGIAIKYPYSTGAHGHEDVDLDHEYLLSLGQMRFNGAVKLYQIMHKVPEGDSSDRYDENYIALDDSYFVTKTGYHDSIGSVYDCTFAQDVYAYEDVYFAAADPEEAPWLTYNNRGDITLKEHIENRLRYHDGKTYALQDESAESNAAWTDLVGLLDYEEGVYADYLLCTACHDGKGGYIYEHSVMRLECFEGVWLITQLRSHLGNEYKRNFEGLVDEPQTAVDIFERDLLKPEGYTLMCDTKLDFDLDGEEELLLLAGKSGERSIFVFDKIYNDWHFTEQLTDERFSGMSTLDAHRYSDGDKDGWFFVNGVVPEEASLVMTEFAPSSEEYDLNGGSYIITDMPTSDETGSGHLCCLWEIEEAGEPLNRAVIDTDNDGENELLVHFGYSLYVFEAVGGYWIKQQEFGEDILTEAELCPSNYGYNGILQTEIALTRSDYDGGCYLFEFWDGGDGSFAQIVAAIKYNDIDGYYIEYVCSHGDFISDEPPYDFCRYGWDEGRDFERISQSEYWALHAELFGYDESAYTTPIEFTGTVSYTPREEEDLSKVAQILAMELLSELNGYGEDGFERTFSIFEYKDITVELCPISEVNGSWQYITAEEKVMENAWIADIGAQFRYDGNLDRTNVYGWSSALYDEYIGFLIWKEGDTYYMRSRYYNNIEWE